MRKKLLAAFVAGGLILGFPAATEAAGAVGASLSGSLQKAEMSGVQRIGGKYYYIDPDTGVRKRGLIRVSGKTYYFTSRWYAVKGFHRVNGRLLFTDARGLVWASVKAFHVSAFVQQYVEHKRGKYSRICSCHIRRRG